MVLVDTSVWILYFREGLSDLANLLNKGLVASHPFIIGEIACGNIKNRTEVLALLQLLPQVTQAKHAEVIAFIESNRLMGRGLGYIDLHLSASARLSRIPVWTLDKRLDETNQELGISFK